VTAEEFVGDVLQVRAQWRGLRRRVAVAEGLDDGRVFAVVAGTPLRA
jgi:hypothetical protein